MPEEKRYTPPPITGYRQLTQTEVDTVNRIKAIGNETLRALIDELRAQNVVQNAQTTDEIRQRSESQRWISIAQTHFQQGLMALARAVTKPEFF